MYGCVNQNLHRTSWWSVFWGALSRRYTHEQDLQTSECRLIPTLLKITNLCVLTSRNQRKASTTKLLTLYIRPKCWILASTRSLLHELHAVRNWGDEIHYHTLGLSKNNDHSSGKMPRQSVQSSKASNPYGQLLFQANCPEHGRLWNQPPLSPGRREKFLHINPLSAILFTLELYLMPSTRTNLSLGVKMLRTNKNKSIFVCLFCTKEQFTK